MAICCNKFVVFIEKEPSKLEMQCKTGMHLH